MANLPRFFLLSIINAQTPFATNPDPTKLFITPALASVLHKCRFVIDHRQGLTLIQGDVGLGKSSLLRYLYNSYSSRDDCVTALIPTPTFISEFAFLKQVSSDFNVPVVGSRQRQEHRFNEFLIEQFVNKKTVILFIDEVQKIPGKQLELIRTLLNFETDKNKLVQIVLSAQLEIREKLLHPSKKAIKSRIFATSTLSPLDLDETAQMINHRCEIERIPNPFQKDAIQVLYLRSRGNPRDLLKYCAIAYELMNQQEMTYINAELADIAGAESEGEV